jgi:hypothetical protein
MCNKAFLSDPTIIIFPIISMDRVNISYIFGYAFHCLVPFINQNG